MPRSFFKYSVFLWFSLVAVDTAYAAFSDITKIFQQAPTMHGFEICMGGGCAELKQVALTNEEWQTVERVFSQDGEVVNAAQERELIALAIGAMESIVGKKTDTDSDLAGTFGNSDYAGQLDCNDEAINSTTYMRLMRSQGLIKFHEVADMRTRNFFFSGWPHTTAVLREIQSGEMFAVDSWFYDNGFPATIVPFSEWKAGFIPNDSPVLK
jgi:hypothetical protein